MLGLDEDWNYVGQQRTANYTNIKPGDYVLDLKLLIMTATGLVIKTIFIKVLSPWWLSCGQKFICNHFLWLGFYIYSLITSNF